MNMRFSTEAANADVLGEETPDAATEGLSAGVGADGTHANRKRNHRPAPKASRMVAPIPSPTRTPPVSCRTGRPASPEAIAARATELPGRTKLQLA